MPAMYAMATGAMVEVIEHRMVDVTEHTNILAGANSTSREHAEDIAAVHSMPALMLQQVQHQH